MPPRVWPFIVGDGANVRDSNQLDLHQAAAQGLKRVVLERLDANASINAKDSEDFTPLHRAVHQGHEAVVTLLLDRGADIEVIGPMTATPLLLAIVVQDVKIARILLDRGANIEALINGLTPLHNAVATGDEDMVNLLLERGANVKARTGCEVGRGETVLHMAVGSGHDKLLPLLIQRGVYVDAQGDEPAGQTALHIAASYGNMVALYTLLDWGADIAARYKNGQTALHRAAAAGRIAMVAFLLDKGVDALAETSQGLTPICMAAMNGETKVMRTLIGRSGDAMSDMQKARALTSAAEVGELGAVRFLVGSGFPVHVVDSSGVTALDMASAFGHNHIVAFLRRAYTNSDLYNAHVKNSLYWATANGHTDIVQLLQEPRDQPIASTSDKPPSGPTGIVRPPVDRDSAAASLSFVLSHFSHRWTMPSGGYPAFCNICQDLNFRRGMPQNAAVVHFVEERELDIGSSADCPGCLIVRQCVKQLASIYKEDLNSWMSSKSIILQSMVDGGPLLVYYNSEVPWKGTLRIEIYSHPGSPTIFPVIGPAREVSAEIPWSGERTDRIRSFVKACTTSHTGCSSRIGTLPTRVLDVGSDNIEPRLYISKGESARYVTLSHSWGGSSPISTTTVTLPMRTKHIRIDELPKTFRDAVMITRDLGIRYLWIDSLCILQDSTEDWEREAAKMATIYEQCYLMIAADESKSCHTGCFPPLSSHWQRTYCLPCLGPYGRSSKVYFRLTNLCQDEQGEICHRLYDSQEKFAPRPLDTRGWTLQERLLAPRIIHFGRFEVGWECTVSRACECQLVQTSSDRQSRFKAQFLNISQGAAHTEDSRFNLRPAPASPAAAPEDSRHKSVLRNVLQKTAPTEDTNRAIKRRFIWINVIREFTRRQLTRSADSLIALSGLASRMSPTAESDYICGIWRENLIQYLLWKPDYHYIRLSNLRNIPRRHEKYYAPSWSWASIIGPVKYADPMTWLGGPYPIDKGEMLWEANDGSVILEMLEAHSVQLGPNPFGFPKSATLTVRGYMAPASFQGKKKALPAQSSENGGVLVSSTTSATNESPASVDFEPDVPNEKAEVSLGDLLYLLFVKDSGDSWEGASSDTSSGYGDGLVLRPVDGENSTYNRVGTFHYQGAALCKEWRMVRKESTLQLV